MQFTIKRTNLAKGTVEYIGTEADMAANKSAGEFGNPFDTFTTYDDENNITGVYVSTGQAWLKY
ncbi:MAG TPA: hypothetical protein PLP87_09065 [Clostridiales bacterium]|nr:hypothetical protein [Clostridiales bacterium]